MIISFDIASKSLGNAIIKINNNWEQDLKKIMGNFNKNINKSSCGVSICNHALAALKLIDKLIDDLINPVFLDVVDLIPGKKVKDVDVAVRAASLKGYLCFLDRLANINSNDTEPWDVLMEYQMGPNDQSRNVGSQILYHYSQPKIEYKSANLQNSSYIAPTRQINVHIVGPSLKNTINFVKGKDLAFFMEKYATSYTANKNHSKANFYEWMKNKDSKLIGKIEKKNMDDVADAVTQALAWLRQKN